MMHRGKYVMIQNGELEDPHFGKSLLSSSEVLYRRLKLVNAKKNQKDLIEEIINNENYRKEREKVARAVLEEERSKKRAMPSREKLPITRRSQQPKDGKQSILPLLPVQRKPLLSRFYNEAQEREIVEAYKEAKKIKDSFHLAFKYSKSDNRLRQFNWSEKQSRKQREPLESKAEFYTDESSKTLRIIVTLPYPK